MIKLTAENYFTPQNIAMSNSKVSDFLQSKEYFYKKHVSREIEFKQTIPMKIGSMVDAMVSGETIPYMVKVLKRDDPDQYDYQRTLDESLLITEDQYDEAFKRASAITKEPFYLNYLNKNSDFQVVLQGHVKYSNKKLPVCGMADVITTTRKTVYIDDFKSVSSMKVSSPQKWFWTCREMGYFRQLAVYKNLHKQMHPRSRKEIVCRHVVVTKVQEDLYKVKLFIIPDQLLDAPWEEFRKTVKLIFKEKDFIDEPVKWKDAVTLIDPKAPIKFDLVREEALC